MSVDAAERGIGLVAEVGLSRCNWTVYGDDDLA